MLVTGSLDEASGKGPVSSVWRHRGRNIWEMRGAGRFHGSQGKGQRRLARPELREPEAFPGLK